MSHVSIVMTYYNRVDQLKNTLDTMIPFLDKGDEIIVIDDGSAEEAKAYPVCKPYNFTKFQVKYVPPQEKNWISPCIPYNMGFQLANNKFVIIQNPECRWVGNVKKAVLKHVVPNTYVTFACQSMNKNGEFVEWFNHPNYNPSNLHFCSAILKEDLLKVHGMDTRFSKGYCFDDNSFLYRIVYSGLKFQGLTAKHPIVQHQWHPKDRCGCIPEWHANKELFQKIKAGELPVWTEDEVYGKFKIK